jgi:predicted phosphohydrolase
VSVGKSVLVRAAADLHGALPEIERCDLVLIAGDIVPVQLQTDLAGSRDWLRGPFREWLEAMPAGEVISIAGNHDLWALEVGAGRHRCLFEIPWVYLRDASHLTDSGLSVYGTPWHPQFGPWAFGASDDRLEAIFGDIPGSTDVLITHTPPFGILDQAPGYNRLGEIVGYPHRGARALNTAIERVRPQLTVFGHIHEAGGKQEYLRPDDPGSGILANVAITDRDFRPVGEPAQFTLRAAPHG